MQEEGSDLTAKELLAKVEADARAAIATIAFLRRTLNLPAWDGALPPTTTPSSTETGREAAANGQIREDEFFRMSIPDGITKFLAMVRKPQPPRAIVDGLQSGGMLSNAKNFSSNVWTALARLKDTGVVVSTPTGWGLSEWYPNRPKGSAETQKKPTVTKSTKAHDIKSGGAAAPKERASSRKVADSAYTRFMAERRAAGRSLVEANADWKAHKDHG